MGIMFMGCYTDGGYFLGYVLEVSFGYYKVL